MIKDKHSIFAINDRSHKDVFIPEWGDEVRVVSMTIQDQMEFEKLLSDKVDQKTLVLNVVVKCCVDEDFRPIFSEADFCDLDKKSPKAIMRIFNSALELNLINESDLDQRAKNS